MKKILVTGANGFTGKYVVAELEKKDYQIIRLVGKKANVDEVECDITNKESVKSCLNEAQPDAIIHLAAISFVGHEDQTAFYNVNLFGTLNILAAIDELGLNLDKVILASSANVYGNPNVTSINEEQVPAPVNHYAMSKLAMEHMSKNWFSKIPIIITRPFNYTGPGQAECFLIPKIVSHFKSKKKQIELGNIDVYRDFSDVRDVARYYVDLLESDAKSQVVNLCSGRVFSIEYIIQKMEKIAGYCINVKVDPDFVRENEIKSLGGDNRKLLELKGTTFKTVMNIEQTLMDMYHER